jgi:hypothetical protein
MAEGVRDAPASVVDDLLHDAADVTVALGKVEDAQARRLLVVVRVRRELTGAA